VHGRQFVAFDANALDGTQPFDLPGRHPVEYVDVAVGDGADRGIVVGKCLLDDGTQAGRR
jgi:hypothetical protein